MICYRIIFLGIFKDLPYGRRRPTYRRTRVRKGLANSTKKRCDLVGVLFCTVLFCTVLLSTGESAIHPFYLFVSIALLRCLALGGVGYGLSGI